MKRLLFLVGTLCMAAAVDAQEITPADVTFDDMRVVLESAGFETYAYDLTSFLEDDTRYEVAVSVKEYDGGKEPVDDWTFHLGSTRVLLSDFSAETRAEIPDSMLLDKKRGIVRQSGRLVLGRYPSMTDSVARWVFSLENGGRGSMQLDLKAVQVPDKEPFYSYESRPFAKSGFEAGKFIPLVFFGSMWYDEKAGVYRQCGESEIAPDLSSEIVGSVPHFYVMGVVLTPKKEE